MLLGYVFLSGGYVLRVHLFRSWRPRWAVWWRILYIGVPSSLQAFTRNVAFAVVIWILSHTAESQIAVAAHTVAGQVRGLSVMIGLAMMSAAMTAVGQNLGASKPERAIMSGWTAVRIAMTASLIAVACYILAGRPIVQFFTKDPTVLSLGAQALLVLAFCEPFLMGGMALSGALRGAGDTMTPLWVSLATTTGLGPLLSYALAIPAAMGPVGVWLGYDVSAILSFALLAFVFRRGNWQQIRLTDTNISARTE